MATTVVESWKSQVTEDSNGFDCNICLDSAQEDPVVTLCGHLYCSPCIYKWLLQSQTQHQQCPVCKAQLSHTTLVPINGRHQPSSNKTKPSPPPPASQLQYNNDQQLTGNMLSGPYGETLYARVFGNTITNIYTYPNCYQLSQINSPRVRNHLLDADKSLDRLSFFILCCLLICLLFF